MRVWSVGHSTHDLEGLVKLLARHRIEQVADVRTVPKSRRHPHFHIDSLRATLPPRGLAYTHLPALGGWRHTVSDSPNRGWRNASFRGYADHAMSADFAAGLEQLRALAAEARTAMMCSEALWWRCHRRLVADRLLLVGDEVLHIGSDGRAVPHRITPFAEVCEGRLIYPEQP